MVLYSILFYNSSRFPNGKTDGRLNHILIKYNTTKFITRKIITKINYSLWPAVWDFGCYRFDNVYKHRFNTITIIHVIILNRTCGM